MTDETNVLLDKARIDAIEEMFMGYALVHDDFKRFAVCGVGTQNLEDKDGNSIYDKPIAIQSTFFIEEDEWFPSAREAIDAAMSAEEAGSDG